MGPKMLLLVALVLLIVTDHSQGHPETYGQSLIVSPSINATADGELLTTASPINTPRQQNRKCNCKVMASIRCHCQQSARRKGKNGKWKRLCQLKKNKNLKRCRWFPKPKDSESTNFGPSVPI